MPDQRPAPFLSNPKAQHLDTLLAGEVPCTTSMLGTRTFIADQLPPGEPHVYECTEVNTWRPAFPQIDHIWEYPGGLLIYPHPCAPGERGVEQTISGYGYATCIGGNTAILEEQMQHVWPLPPSAPNGLPWAASGGVTLAGALLAVALGLWLVFRLIHWRAEL